MATILAAVESAGGVAIGVRGCASGGLAPGARMNLPHTCAKPVAPAGSGTHPKV